MDDNFVITCIAVWQNGRDYRSIWQNVSDEGIVTEVAFSYEDMDGCEDKVGDRIPVTMHLPFSTSTVTLSEIDVEEV